MGGIAESLQILHMFFHLATSTAHPHVNTRAKRETNVRITLRRSKSGGKGIATTVKADEIETV